MRIGIDARFYGTEVGIGRVLVKLLANLEKIVDDNEYVVFLKASNFDRYLPQDKRFRKVLADVPYYSFKEQVVLPRIFTKEKLDLIFVPHLNIPIFYSGKMIVMIHDLIITQFKSQRATLRNPIIYRFKHFSYQLVLKRAIQKAVKIIVPTQVVKAELVGKFSLPEEKVVVINEASDEIFSQEILTEEEKSKVREKYSVKDFILAVGNNSPHKNLACLVKSLKKLEDVKLVLVSPENEFLKRLKTLAREIGVENKIVFSGSLQDNDLKALYETASLLVFPSFAEGFGLPGLEAMSVGLPVICSDIPVFREVYGDSALYFDPNDPQDLAVRINLLLKEKEIREKYIKLGFAQVKKYSWERFASQVHQLFDSVN